MISFLLYFSDTHDFLNDLLLYRSVRNLNVFITQTSNLSAKEDVFRVQITFVALFNFIDINITIMHIKLKVPDERLSWDTENTLKYVERVVFSAKYTNRRLFKYLYVPLFCLTLSLFLLTIYGITIRHYC